MLVSYTIADSSLGRLLVGTTLRGICAVSLGDSDAALEKSLLDSYPAADLQTDEAGLSQWVDALKNYINGGQRDLNLPLDVRATDFQWRVWEELRTIPYGSTRSYGEMARSLGYPNAARAVGRACAANPVAIAIPCHRVIRSDSSLGGYRWGLERKQALLAQEQAIAIACSAFSLV